MTCRISPEVNLLPPPLLAVRTCVPSMAHVMLTSGHQAWWQVTSHYPTYSCIDPQTLRLAVSKTGLVFKKKKKVFYILEILSLGLSASLLCHWENVSRPFAPTLPALSEPCLGLCFSLAASPTCCSSSSLSFLCLQFCPPASPNL